MILSNVTIGQMVIRTVGDYVVGRTGSVLEIDQVKGRVRVDWTDVKTWVSAKAIEDAARPHQVVRTPGKNPKVIFTNSANKAGLDNEGISCKVMYKGQLVDAINYGSVF